MVARRAGKGKGNNLSVGRFMVDTSVAMVLCGETDIHALLDVPSYPVPESSGVEMGPRKQTRQIVLEN
jgi:hypothetical protein